ncbi:MAG: sigma-70 family RNA polymerase sigma factor [Phycisphaerales bacterium]|nr:sigma-70 family RNA polymerase sigma factor [Phycisphaerales bacterium]
MSTDYSQTSLTLLNHVGDGNDPVAERRFVERYGRMVRGIARAAGLNDHDADDVVQETLIAAVQALREKRYDRQLGRFKAWLKGVLFHKIAHFRRKSGLPRAAGFSPRDASSASSLSREESGCSPLPAGGGRVRANPSPDSEQTQVPASAFLSSSWASSLPLEDIPDPSPPPDEQTERAFEQEWMQALYEEAADEVRNEVEPQTWQAFHLVVNHGWSPVETARHLGIRRSAVDNAKSRILKRLRDKVEIWGLT